MSISQEIKTKLGKCKTMFLRKVSPTFRSQRGDEAEKQHWAKLFESKKSLFSDPDFKNRADPGRKLQPELSALLSFEKTPTLVLDVGCGPLSTVGMWDGANTIDLHGADPLASEYMQLLNRISIEPNCHLAACAGQDLDAHYGIGKFDLVTSINALDHSESPTAVFRKMIEVCKVGGYVYLYHAENEGLYERYHGMHQWNFRNEGGRLVANDGRRSFDLLDGTENVIVFSEKTIPAKPRPFLEWIFKKTAES